MNKEDEERNAWRRVVAAGFLEGLEREDPPCLAPMLTAWARNNLLAVILPGDWAAIARAILAADGGPMGGSP